MLLLLLAVGSSSVTVPGVPAISAVPITRVRLAVAAIATAVATAVATSATAPGRTSCALVRVPARGPARAAAILPVAAGLELHRPAHRLADVLETAGAAAMAPAGCKVTARFTGVIVVCAAAAACGATGRVVVLATVRTSAVSTAAICAAGRAAIRCAVSAAAVLTLRLPVCRSRARWGRLTALLRPALLVARRRAVAFVRVSAAIAPRAGAPIARIARAIRPLLRTPSFVGTL